MLNPEAKLNNKGFAKVVLIIIAVAVLTGAWAGYLVIKNKQRTAAFLETERWKICRNDKYGYEVKYPFGWEVWKSGAPEARKATCEENLSIISFSPNLFTNQPQISIDVSDGERLKGTIYEGVKSLDDYFSRSPAILQARPIIEESVLDGEKLVWHKDGSLTAFHNNSIFEFYRKDVDDWMMEKFFSTFKFTK
jgi:hypothetical protein